MCSVLHIKILVISRQPHFSILFYPGPCKCQTDDKMTGANDLEFLPEFHVSSQHQTTSYDGLYGFHDLVPCQHREFDEIQIELLNFIGLFGPPSEARGA